MSTIDLSQYDPAQLKALQRDIDKEISGRAQEELRKAREQVLAIAQSVGIAIRDLVADAGKKARATKGITVAAQYCNPADPSKTWAGRGRKPQWVTDALNNGKKLEDLRV
jgi:DNA-binding protein H-NS